MARGLQKIGFEGKMNKDVAPEKLPQGDYSSAKNIQFLTSNTESTGDHIPMLGNTAAFSLGSVLVQNKTYRLYTSNTGIAPLATLLFFSNGIQFSATHTINWAQNQPIAAQASAIQTAIRVWDSSATVTAGTTYVDITLNLIAGYDFTISATDGNGASMTFNTLYEAYDATLAGELHAIGSYDLLGDLYVWSTTGTNLPIKTTLTVVAGGVSLAAVGTRQLYQITFSTAHGLSAGQSINLLGDIGTELDGTWIVSATGLTDKIIVLEDYFNRTLPATLPASMVVTLYSQSIGEIGVAQYTASTNAWAYTRLGRTKQWGFRTKKQPDTYCEHTSVKSSIYWTDDLNVPRVIYYIYEYDANNNKQAFETDGIISTINSTGSYTYETILLESSLQLSESGVRILFKQQLQAGGQIPSGNWRYATRFLTESLTATSLTDVTNPVNTYSASASGNAYIIIGDAPDTVTPKINQLEVTGILPGLFKYIELIGVNYVGESIVGYNIRRESLDSTQTSIILNHTGTETNTSDFDLGLLNQVFEQVATAKNITVIDKRMILSNLTTKQKQDCTEWAHTFKHSIARKTIDSVQDNISGNLRVGEYQDPVNVNTNMGLMHNETYRWSCKGHFKSGGFSDNFHIDDIVINCESTNVDIFGNPPSGSVGTGRRVSGLTNFDLTDGGTGAPVNVYVPYINFSNIDFDYKIDGIPVREIFDFIEIERCEVANPTILACGYAVASVQDQQLMLVTPALYYSSYSDSSSGRSIGEFPFISGRTSGTANPPYDAAEFTDPPGCGRDGTVVAFYSPDIQFNHTSITGASGDVLINFGNPNYVRFNNNYGFTGADMVKSNYAQWNGVTGASLAQPPTRHTLDQSVFVGTGESVTLQSNKIYRKAMGLYDIPSALTNYSVNYSHESLVAETDGSVIGRHAWQPSDYGFYYNQYYRAVSDQYGDTENSTYVTCGHRMSITASMVGMQNTDVFGGDVFTQLHYFRHRRSSLEDITYPGRPAPVAAVTGFGGAVSFYSQNRINVQMKHPPVGSSGDYPGIATDFWLSRQGSDGSEYNEGYTIRNEVQSHIAFNSDTTDSSDQPARIRWSAIKPQGSPSDQYRIYLPLDFHDLDQANGEIVHHANGNGELLTWQQRAFMRQYFNTRGTLEVKGISEILIGDGSVMSRDGVTVSRLGSRHKWAIIKGKSVGGNDVFYWLNTELKKALRFGYDGTVSIADIKGMQSFLANNLTWVDLRDTPADGSGICGVWDDRYANAIWTVRGINPSKTITAWNSSSEYANGAIVSYPSNSPFSIVNGDIYEKATGANGQPDLFPLVWRKISDNGEVYNQYTIIFNEFKNAFICDTTPTPKIYLKWTDTYLSPRPISPESQIYQHDKGSYLTWYLSGGTSQTERGFIEGIVNQFPEETKSYEAIGVDSEISPIRFEFETRQHESFLTQSEFTSRTDSFVAPIKKDSTTSGINSSNTSTLFGKYMKAKMYFEVGVYQRLSNFIVKFRINSRLKSK